MIIAVTGMTGFLGSNLFNALNDRCHQIYGITREELSDEEILREKLKRINPDFIFHLAAYGNHSFQTDEKEAITVNILKTFMLLKASRNIEYKALFNFSTSSVQLKHQTFYSATKASMEFISNAFGIKYNKKIINIRPASVFGEGEADFRFIPTMVNKIATQTIADLDEEPNHSWIYVKDFCSALIHIMDYYDKVEHGESIAISYGKQWSNKDIVTMLEEASGKKLIYNPVERTRYYDTKDWLVNNDRITELGWKPQYSLIEGLRNTYNWYAK